MKLEKFVDLIRFDILEKKYTAEQVAEYLHSRGWFTTKDVPQYQRVSMLKDLRSARVDIKVCA